MDQNTILKDIASFLKRLNLSNYETRTYITSLQASVLTAKELSRKARVPSGRIYDVLEKLNEKGLIEIQQSRPKLYHAVPPNVAFNNLINHLKEESKRQISVFYDQAKVLESKIKQTRFQRNSELNDIFWSTAFGASAVMKLYVKKLNELKEEFLMTGFITKETFDVLPYGAPLFANLVNALHRGVQIKTLWSFEFDKRPLSEEEKKHNLKIFEKFQSRLKELFNISPDRDGLEIRLIHERFPTYYDILDRKRVLIKLQNPVKPSQFYACLNILDINLAKELRRKYFAIWRNALSLSNHLLFSKDSR
ncbi:MAG: TrmB family transcriptional regulator [Candidatus Helarchaeota archaeon]